MSDRPILRSFLPPGTRRLRPFRSVFALPALALVLLLAGVFFAGPEARGETSCTWLRDQKWKVKMHLTQVLDQQGSLAEGETCSYDYTLALNHVSDVTGTFESTGEGGIYEGTLTSEESVSNRLDGTAYGDEWCPLGNFYFSETGEGSGTEENATLTIDPGMGKYTIAFPHTGIDVTTVYQGGMYGYWSGTLRKEINTADFVIDYPGIVLTASQSEPVASLEFPLPSSSPQVITGETTLSHSQYPEIPVTWSWELTPGMGEAEAELGSPMGKGKANGGAHAPGAAYGEPVWSVNMAVLNLFVTDTPLWYRSPIGPPVEVSLSYNSQSATARFEPIGRKWQLNYESYLAADPITGDVTIYMPDGRRDVYTYTPTGFTPPYRVFNELKVIRPGEIMEGSDYELTFPDGTVYVYKVPSGSLLWAFLTEIRDPYGNKLTLQWEGQSPWGGLLNRITDAMGRITHFFRDANDRITSIRDPFGRTAIFNYDSEGNLTRITDMGGYATTFSYDGCGMMESMLQGGNSVYFEWDDTGLTVRDNMGSERFVLNALLESASYQGANAQAGDTYAYEISEAQDGSKNKDVTSFQTPEGDSFAFTYDPKGNLLTETLEAGSGNETSEYRYNAKGKVTYIRDAMGAVTTLTYASNNVDLLTLENGLGTITATYNAHHDILTLTNRQGQTKSFAYNEFGQVEHTFDNLGIQTDYVYNDDHQLIQVVRAGAVIAAYEYDEIGRVSSSTDSNGMTRGYTYNALDDLLSVSFPDGSVMTYSRSPSVPHLLDSLTDQALRTTEYKYNAHKQLREIIDPEGGRIQLTSDAAGNVTHLSDQNESPTSFGYNKDNLLTSKTFADGSMVLHSYTGRRLTWSQNARGIETRYTYDKNGNLLTISYSDGTPGVTFTYDSFNRPIHIEDGLGVQVRTYDANSRLTSIDGPWANDTLTLGYDALGRRTSMALENGQALAYSYDNLNRLTTVAGNGLNYSYAYQGSSNLLNKLSRSDGSWTDYAYDSVMKRLQRLTNRTRTGAILNEYTFAYDVLGQPTEETVTNGPPLDFGNLAEAIYTYNNLNQAITRNGSNPFSYDADGNMTGGLTGGGLPFVAEYDAENRLISIQFTDQSGTARRQEFSYGHDGFLGIRRDYANGILAGEQRFVRDGAIMLQARNGANGIEREYIWGLAKPGGVGALLALVQGGETYQYYSNPRGDITAVLDSAGATAAAYAYDPFGVPLAATGTLDQPMRFSTKPYDEQTGLSYYGYRFYSPQLGRWLSRDPLAEKGSINLYSFVSGNPLAQFDPYGAEETAYALADTKRKNDEFAARVAEARKEAGLPDSDTTASGFNTDELKGAVETTLKDKLWDTMCGALPICKTRDKPELYVGKDVGLEVNGVEVAKGEAELGVGIRETENPTARGPLFTLRMKVKGTILKIFDKEAEFSTEFGDMSSTGTGSTIDNATRSGGMGSLAGK